MLDDWRLDASKTGLRAMRFLVFTLVELLVVISN